MHQPPKEIQQRWNYWVKCTICWETYPEGRY